MTLERLRAQAGTDVGRALRWVAIGLVAVSALLVGLALAHLRLQALDEGRRLTESIAQIIEEQTTRTLQAVDQQLQLAVAGLEGLRSQGRLDEGNARTLLRGQLKDTPFLRAIWALDAQHGRITFDTDLGNIGIPLADRPYFQIYSEQPQTGFYLGAPVRSRSTGGWLISAARPLHGPDGKLAYVVAAALEPPYFDKLWRSVNLGEGASVALFRGDGRLMMRSPLDDAVMGKSFAGVGVFNHWSPQHPMGSYRGESNIDGKARIFAYRALSSHPDLLVVVGQAEDTMLAQWRRLVWVVVAVWLAGVLTMLALTVFLASAWRTADQARAEAALHTQRLALSTDAAQIGVWEWQIANPRNWYASSTYSTMLGYDPDEGPAQRQRWMDRVHPEDRTTVEATVDAVLQGANVPYDYEARMRHADGSWRWVHVVGKVQARDATGKPTQITGVRMDITQHKTAQQALRDSEARYRELFLGNPQPMWVLDPQSHAFLAVNQAALARYGYSLNDFLCMTAEQILPHDQRDLVDAQMVNPPHVGPPARTWTHVRKDGSTLLVEVSSHALTHGGRDARLVLSTDVTELRRSQQELERYRAHLEDLVAERTAALAEANKSLQQVARFNRTAMDAVPGTIAYWDATTRCRFVNQVYLDYFGVTPEQVLNRSAADIFGEQWETQIREPMLAGLAGQPQEFERTREFEGRGRFTHRVHYLPDRGADGKVAGVFVMSFDITALKTAEEELKQSNHQLTDALAGLERAKDQLVQSETMAALGSLVAGVSHELNTPIGNVLVTASALGQEMRAFSELVLSGSGKRSDFMARSARLVEAGELIERNAQRAGKLVADFKQVAVDQTSARRRAFQLHEVVAETINLMAHNLKRAGHEVEQHVPEGIHMDGYPGPLEQVITNLLGNSLLHAFEGRHHGRVTLSAEVDAAQQIVTLRYEDNGVGIRPDALHRVFEPFFTTKLGHGGSGLGLYIVYNLVTGVLGGNVEISSQPGEGTRFTMTLPLVTPGG